MTRQTLAEQRAEANECIRLLRLAGYEVLWGDGSWNKGHGYWIRNTINSRTGTTWHSHREAWALASACDS